jgi:hypothetical protein
MLVFDALRKTIVSLFSALTKSMDITLTSKKGRAVLLGTFLLFALISYNLPEKYQLINLIQRPADNTAVNTSSAKATAVKGEEAINQNNVSTDALKCVSTGCANLYQLLTTKTTNPQPLKLGGILLTKNGELFIVTGSVVSDSIRRHTIKNINLGNNSITSRTIKDHEIKSQDLNHYLEIQHLTIKNELTIEDALNTESINTETIDLGTNTITDQNLTGNWNFNGGNLTTGNIDLGGNTLTTTNTNLITNLNADLLDNQHGSYYAPLANITGTQNYLAKFTATHSVGNSVIYDNGTNVGIGTTNPGAALVVTGVSAEPVIGSSNGVASVKIGSDNLAFGYSTNYNWMQSYGNLPLYINPLANNVIFNRDGAGNVGIGTTNPGTALEIGGSGKLRVPITNDATNPTIQFGSGGTGFYSSAAGYINVASSGTAIAYFSGGIGVNASNGPLLVNYNASATYPTVLADRSDADTGIGTAGANILSLIAGGTNVMNITSGNIGIGTTGPGAKLEIYGTASDTKLKLNAGASGTFVASQAGGITYLTASAQLGIEANGSEVIRINSGNVGIGTTNPATKLEIKGTDTELRISDTTYGWGLKTSDVGQTFKIIERANNRDVITMTTTGYVGFSTVGTEKMRLTTNGGLALGNSYVATDPGAGNMIISGNVGIGTTNPGALLQISTRFKFNSDGTANWGSAAANGELSWDTGKAIIRGISGQALSLAANGSIDQLYIKTDGNVGIGTTSPAYSLDVAGTTLRVRNTTVGTGSYGQLQVASDTATTYINALSSAWTVGVGSEINQPNGAVFSGAGAGGVALGSIHVDGNLRFYTGGQATANERLRITNSGNVGIGTTSPGAKFQIYTGDGTSGLRTSLICSNSTTSKLYTDANGNMICGTDQTGSGTGNLVDTLSATLGAGNDAGGLGITNLGNVGIGTTSPGQKLDIGNGNARIFGSDGFDSTNDRAVLYLGDYGSGGATGAAGIAAVWNSGLRFGVYKSAGGGTIGSDSMDAMTILQTSGNVGIGTTSPGANLHVYNPTSSSINLKLERIDTTSPTLWLANSAPTGVSNSFIWLTNNTTGTTKWSDGAIMGIDNSAIANLQLWNYENGNMLFGTNGTEQMRISNAGLVTMAQNLVVSGTGNTTITGNVGIGTTDPIAKLQVVGGNIYVGTYTQLGTSSLQLGTSSNIATVRSAAGTTYLNLFGGGGTGATIDNSGNVGIGTTGPGAKLHIISPASTVGLLVDGSAAAGVGIAGFTAPGNVAMQSVFGINVTGDSFGRVSFGLDSGAPYFGFGTGATQRDVFLSRSAANTFRISSDGASGLGNLIINGNVGIGTTGPGAKLQVAGGGVTFDKSYDLSFGTQRTLVWSGTKLAIGTSDTSSVMGGKLAIGTETAQTDLLHVTGTGNVVFNNTGNVGIGNTAPLSKLGITGNASIGATYGAIAAPTSGLIVEGNVGIGTTGPGAKLEVSSTGDARAIIIRKDTANKSTPDFSIYNSTGIEVFSIEGGEANTQIRIGIDAAKNADANANNLVSIGYQANNALVNQYGITSIGYRTAYSRGGGHDSTYLGFQAGYGDAGFYNVYLGGNSGYGAWNGNYNVAVGNSSLNAVYSGSNNTALGYKAGYGVSNTYANNIFIGYQAGDNIATGANNNIIIGYDIDLPTATSTNTLNIGNLIYATGLDGAGTTLSTGNVGIGVVSPGYKLAVNGSLNVAGAISMNGQTAITSSGARSYTFGYQAVAGSNDSLSMGDQAGCNAAANYRTLIGNSTARYAGDWTVALGYGAGFNQTGTGNTFLGSYAGGASSFPAGGNNNVLVGYTAGYTNQGAGNIFLGYAAGYSETGSNKLYIANSNTSSPLIYGDFATSVLAINGNVGIGTTAPNVKLVVYDSGALLPTMSLQDGDITIPDYSGTGINPDLNSHEIARWTSASSASGGVHLIGFTDTDVGGTPFTLHGIAGSNDPTDTTPIILLRGSKHNGSTSNTVLANSETVLQIQNYTSPLVTVLGSGNVGIGTTGPLEKLDTNGAIVARGGLTSSIIGQGANTVAYMDVSGNYARFGAGSDGANNKGILFTSLDGGGLVNAMSISNSGKVGIGTTSPGAKLDVNGTIKYVDGTGDSNTAICKNSLGQLAPCSSLSALKNSVQDLGLGLETLMKLRPVKFNWNASEENDLGFIAEEVAAINPLLAVYSETGKLQGVKYPQLTSLLTSAIQEQQAQIGGLTENQNKIVNQLTGQLANQNLTVDNKLQLIGQALDDVETHCNASLREQIDVQKSDLLALQEQMADIQTNMYLERYDELWSFYQNFELAKVPLKNALENVFEGKIVASDIEALNTIKAKDIEAETLKLEENKTTGKAVISAGENEVKIMTPEAKAEAKIYITPTGKLSGRSLYVDPDKIEEGESFKVELEGEVLDKAANFNWLIVR